MTNLTYQIRETLTIRQQERLRLISLTHAINEMNQTLIQVSRASAQAVKAMSDNIRKIGKITGYTPTIIFTDETLGAPRD